MGHPLAPRLLTTVLAQQLAVLRAQDAHVPRVPLHPDDVTDVPRGHRVVRTGDLDVAVEVDGAGAVLVVVERLNGQWLQVRLLLGKHRRDLALGGAVDAGIGPAFLPVIEMYLGLLEALETHPLQGRFLCMVDATFDLALTVGVSDPARQCHHAVVGEHVVVQGIELGS